MIIINQTEKCKYQAQKPKMIHSKSKDVRCDTDEFENKLRKEIERMAVIKVLGAEIPRASEETIKTLIDCGVIYIGEDNQLHALDLSKNIPTEPTKAKGKDIE